MMPSQRKLGTLVFLLLVALCVTIPSFAFQNEPDGFRGIKWGADISELPDMRFDNGGENGKDYLRKDDKMKIGDADITRLLYSFYKDKFYAVLIFFESTADFELIRNSLFDHYGFVEKLRTEKAHIYVWEGVRTKITLTFYVDSKGTSSGFGHIIYTYLPLSELQQKLLKEKNWVC